MGTNCAGPTKLRVRGLTPLSLLSEYYADTEVIDIVSVDLAALGPAQGKRVMEKWPFEKKWCVNVFNVANEDGACTTSRQGLMSDIEKLMSPQGYEHRGVVGVHSYFVRQARGPCRRRGLPSPPTRPVCGMACCLSSRGCRLPHGLHVPRAQDAATNRLTDPLLRSHPGAVLMVGPPHATA